MTLPSFQEQEESVCLLICLLICKHTVSPPGIAGDFIREHVSKMSDMSLTFIRDAITNATYSQEARAHWMDLKGVIGDELYDRSMKQ